MLLRKCGSIIPDDRAIYASDDTNTAFKGPFYLHSALLQPQRLTQVLTESEVANG